MIKVISPKAHFNDRKLTEAVIEPGTEEIGDWAFAKCTNLRKVVIPAGCRISARAFEDCLSLTSVVVYDCVTETETVLSEQFQEDDLSHLLGLAIRNWPDMADLIIRGVSGEYQDREGTDSEVPGLIDSRLKLYLAEPDDAGFMPFLAGGEEDYDDVEEARRRYVQDRVVNKVFLVYERIRIAGPDAAPPGYVDYLRRYNPEITFAVLMMHGPHVSEYRSLYFDLGLNIAEQSITHAADDSQPRMPDEACADMTTKSCPDIDMQSAFTQTLLDISSHDAELRAMVLTHNPSSFDVFDSSL